MKAERHENADMICAKANNMNLVVLARCKASDGWCWIEVEMESLSLHPSVEHFLCLPQHKEACLHWLNGGDVEVSGNGERWEEYNLSVEHPKYPMTDFTGYEFQFRIKPKKEKRWIAYSTNQKRLGCLSFDSEQEARAHYIHEVDEPQFIEIEVEV